MSTAAAMPINGVMGRWSEDGLQWTATDLSADVDTLVLVRISDAEEGDADGVARQVANAIIHARKTDARIGRILVENDTSAFKRRKITLPNGDKQLRTVRPQFRKALRLLDRGEYTRFLAVHLDRAVRDPRDLEDLIDVVEQSRPRIVCDSVTGSLKLACDADITMARVMCAIANAASRDTARRVSDKRRALAQEGRHGGGPRRYGFAEDGITVRQEEAKWIRKATRLAMGDVPIRELTRDLTAQGWRRPDGEQWTSVGVRDMLLRPCNAGLTVHVSGRQGERIYYTPDDVVGKLPGRPIIEPERYWTLVRKLTDPERTTTPGTAVRWFGSGIFRCPCGSPLRVQNKKYKRTDRRTKRTWVEEREVYRCQQSSSGHVTCERAELDRLVVATLLELIATSDPADIIGTRTAAEDVAALYAEQAEHSKRLEEIAADREADVITREQMLEMTATRRRKLEKVKERLAAVAAEEDPAAQLVGAKDIRAAWDALTLGEQRKITARLLSVEVQPVGRGKRAAVHERVIITRTKRPKPPRKQPRKSRKQSREQQPAPAAELIAA
ncbi:recombinase family protein [Spirillospora sp. CA-255316]